MLTLCLSQELQKTFASCFLSGAPALKKITFFSLKQPLPLPDFDTAHFCTFIASLGSQVRANLKLIRYMHLNQVRCYPFAKIEVHYHRETPVDGDWWMRLPWEECEQIFAEGCTPRVVPVGKWDCEIEAEIIAHLAELGRRL